MLSGSQHVRQLRQNSSRERAQQRQEQICSIQWCCGEGRADSNPLNVSLSENFLPHNTKFGARIGNTLFCIKFTGKIQIWSTLDIFSVGNLQVMPENYNFLLPTFLPTTMPLLF